MKQLSFDFGEQYARDRIRESPLGNLKIKQVPKVPPLLDTELNSTAVQLTYSGISRVVTLNDLEVKTKCP